MRSAVRLSLLCAVALAAAASGTQQGARQAPPPQPYPQQHGAPVEGGYFCTDLDGAESHGSLCFADPARCDQERGAAESDGLGALPCRLQTPVSCFQLGDDPSPSMQVCAASPEDCDLWRLIDQDKNGRTGAPCQWRHAGAQSLR